MTDPLTEAGRTSRIRLSASVAVAFVMITSIGAGLVLAEMALRLFGPRETRYYVLRPNLRQAFEPQSEFVPGISGRANFTVNSLGLRGEELPDDSTAYRILVVGGSTSENVYLDDTETWTHLLQEQLGPLLGGRRVWVGAAARGGMNTRDHIVQVKHLLEQLPRMDLLLLLVGVNDLTVALAQSDTFRAPPALSDPEVARLQEARAFSVVPGALHRDVMTSQGGPWYKRLALWQLGVRTRAAISRRGGQRSLTQDTRAQAVQRWREARQRATTWRDDPPELTAALAEYRRNLESIFSLATEHGVPVSFMTQPSLWRADLDSAATRLLWFGGIGNFQLQDSDEYYAPIALAEAMAAYNGEMLRVCESHVLRCMDLARDVPRSTDYFFDDVHFTERGSQLVASAIVAWLAQVAEANRDP